MASDDLADALYRMGATHDAYEVADWLRSPESRAVVARALGLVTVEQSEWHVSNQEDNAYDAGVRFGRRETALKIADAIDTHCATLARQYDKRIGLEDVRTGAVIARSFAEESSEEESP